MNDLRGSPIDSIAESLDMPQDQLDMTNEMFSTIEDVVGFNINSDLIIGSSEGRGISKLSIGIPLRSFIKEIAVSALNCVFLLFSSKVKSVPKTALPRKVY